MKTMYSTRAKAQAGRAGHVESEDGKLSLDLSVPTSMGGPGGDGTNPEQLFAGGYAACFHSAMQFIAGQKKIDLSGSSVTGEVGIGERPDGPGFALAVTLDIDLPSLPQADADELVQTAHAVCPYSNATRGNIDVQLKVSGKQTA